MNPNPGTTRRALGRGAPHGALWPGRSKTLSSQGARDTLVPEPPGAARRSQPRRGEPAPHSRTPPLLWDATQAAPPKSPALREVCAAPPSVSKSHAPCQEGPRLCLKKPRPARRGPAFWPLAAPPLAGNCSARCRQELAPAPRDLLSLSSIETALAFRTPGTRLPRPRPLETTPAVALSAPPPWACPLHSSRAPSRCQQSRAPVSCGSASSRPSPAGAAAPASDRKS